MGIGDKLAVALLFCCAGHRRSPEAWEVTCREQIFD